LDHLIIKVFAFSRGNQPTEAFYWYRKSFMLRLDVDTVTPNSCR